MASELEILTQRASGERQAPLPKTPTPKQVLDYVDLVKEKLERKRQKSKKKKHH